MIGHRIKYSKVANRYFARCSCGAFLSDNTTKARAEELANIHLSGVAKERKELKKLKKDIKKLQRGK